MVYKRTCIKCGKIKTIGETQFYAIKRKERKSICSSCAQKGKKVTDIVKDKIAKKLKGRHISKDTEFKKGQVSWNKGKKFSKETKNKMSLSKIGRRRSKTNNWKGGRPKRNFYTYEYKL